MQSKINNKVQFGQAFNPLNNVVKVWTVDNSSDLKDVFTKIDKLKKLWDNGTMDFDLIRYLPGMGKISRQGQIFSALPQRAHASPNWSDLSNLNNMHLYIPM